jgi:hypothetical protein
MTDSPPVHECEDLWFHDGSIVIRAESTLFRVYSGVLASASPIFKDMFGVPQPQSLETYDGVPLILLPDRAFDVTQFLKALLYPGCVTLSFFL